ncbi:MAG: hypothetical protein ACREHD_12395 [Pirellulales bacterium]
MLQPGNHPRPTSANPPQPTLAAVPGAPHPSPPLSAGPKANVTQARQVKSPSLQFVSAKLDQPPVNLSAPLPPFNSDQKEELPRPPANGEIASARPTPLTLPAAIETSLEQNPDLVALRQAEGVSRAVVGVARSFPFNPFFQFQATPVEQAPASAVSSEPNAAQKIYQYYLVMQTF